MERTRQKRTAKVILTALISAIMVLTMIFAIQPATTLPALAEGETIEIYTNKKQWSYSSGCVTINVNDKGDEDGAKIDENRLMAISASGNVVIKNAKVRIGYYYEVAGAVRSDVCDEVSVEGSGDKNTYVTFSNVNAKKITILTTFDMVQIDRVSLELIPVNGVTYELNGGSFNGEYIDYYFDDQGLTLPTNAVKSHYNFLGWYDNAELTGNAVTAIGADETGSKTFWAKWELTKHNITYNTNEGEWNGEYSTTYQETIGLTLPTNVTKPHFTFAGWYSNAEFDGEAVTEITNEDSGDKEYWAKWERITHNITYHLNGGEWKDGISAPTSFNEGEMFDLFGPSSIFPVKTGFMFYGWFTSDTLDEESYIEIIQPDETNDVEVWAAWGLRPVMPTIEDVFPTAGETEHKGEVVTVTATANENGFVLDKTHSITITFEKGLFPDDGIYLVVADGYEYNPQPEYITSEYEYSEQFITSSWGDINHGGYSHDGINIFSGPIIFAPYPFDFDAFKGSITVTISDEYSEKSLVFKQIHIFAHHVHTVTYNVNGGIMPGDYPTKYLEARGLELAVPIRNGYTFMGWYDNEELEGEAVTKITVADTGNKVFYAKWEFIEVVDLSKVTDYITIYDGQTITGELQENVKVTIADGATVTLKDVIIKGENNHDYDFAGITLEGDATLILEGKNTVTGFEDKYPGIYVPQNKTLTISGKGTLDVSSNGYATGIGAGYDIPCGNIVIEGGTINAIGGVNSAGIGGGYNLGNCGTITIKGGVVNATGGDGGAGIGGGERSQSGDITITDKAKKVTAVSGSGAPNSIGSGKFGNAVCVTIDGEVFEEGISDHDFVYSSVKAEEFVKLIEELGTVEYSEEYKKKLEEARETYNYLSNKEKAKVDAATLKVLTDAEEEYKNLEDGAKADEATGVIDGLPNDITIDNKEAVEAARKAYDALTNEQKAKVDPETLAKLEAAEKEINDIETSNQVIETINNLPLINEITSADKDAIKAARKAYEDLSDEAKKKVSKEIIDNLEAAELTLAIAIFDEEFEKVPASADEITNSDKEAIEAAREAYEALNEEQKSQFPQDKLNKLEEAETALAYVTFNEEFAKIPVNSEDITTADKEAIEAARKAYEALTEEQKSQFPQDKLNKLKEAENALAVITVSEAIDVLPSSDGITSADKDAIKAARNAYEALTEEQKLQFPQDKLNKLKEAENTLAVIMVSEAIDVLPSSDGITSADKEAIEVARKAYEALTEEQKTQFPQDKLNKLEEAESILAVITLSEAIVTLPSSDGITFADKEAIEEAREAYEALTPEQKEMFPAETLALLVNSEKAFDTISKINDIGEINNSKATKEAIEQAKAAYDALTDKQKELLDENYVDTLLNSVAVQEAIDVINGIGDVVKYDANSKNAIEAAREAYKALTNEQKGMFPIETLKAIENSEKVYNVLDKIYNIGDVDYDTASEEKINDAVTSYEALTEEQKAMVDKEAVSRLRNIQQVYQSKRNAVNAVSTTLLVVSSLALIGGAVVLFFLLKGLKKGKGVKVNSFGFGLSTLIAYASHYADAQFIVAYIIAALAVMVWIAVLVVFLKKKQMKKAAATKNTAVNNGVNKENFSANQVVSNEKPDNLVSPLQLNNNEDEEEVATVKDEKGLIEEVKTKVEPKEEPINVVTVEKADELMSDEKAEEYIMIHKVENHKEGKKGVINIDTLSDNYLDGEEVTLESLIEKGLISSNVAYVKLLARGSLNKKLIVDLDDYSLKAVKMIVLLGGEVKKIN